MAGSTRKFGVTSDVAGLSAGCIVNSITHNFNSDTAQARDEKGRLIDLAAYGENEEISIEGLTTGSGVSNGSVITIGGKNYLVTSTSTTENNTAFQTQSVTARYSKNCEYWTTNASGEICAPSATTNSDTVPNSGSDTP